MAFEVFEHRGRTFSGTPLLSISKNGMFSLNGAARTQRFKKTERVILLYDRETNRVAVKPIKKERPNAYKISSKNGLAMFAATSFLKYYKIDYNRTRKYVLAWDETLKAAVADLNEVHYERPEKKPPEDGTPNEDNRTLVAALFSLNCFCITL